jgi:hypothetical protein
VSDQSISIKRVVARECALLLWLVLAGVLLLPVAIYLVGQPVFGDYGDGGIGDFYGNLHAELRAGNAVVWFLMLSPYIAWQLFRLTLWGFRHGPLKK